MNDTRATLVAIVFGLLLLLCLFAVAYRSFGATSKHSLPRIEIRQDKYGRWCTFVVDEESKDKHLIYRLPHLPWDD